MSDEGGGFDPCECVWNHEMAMRRLLNVLRNSQSYCSDNECITDDPNFRQSNPDQMLLITLLVVAGLFLYFFRPRRQATEGPSKALNSDQNGAPPNPPPAMN